MGDQDDIQQAKFMAFIARKAGSRSWIASARAKQLKVVNGTAVIPRDMFDEWKAEFEANQ